MKKVDVYTLKKELDPLAGEQSYIKEDLLMDPANESRFVPVLSLEGDFTLDDLRKIFNAYDDTVETVEVTDGGEAPKAPPITKYMIYLFHEGYPEGRTLARAYIGPYNLGDDYVLEDQFIYANPGLFGPVDEQIVRNGGPYDVRIQMAKRRLLHQRYTEQFEDWVTKNLGLTAIPFMEVS
jgi:hypothetical protein